MSETPYDAELADLFAEKGEAGEHPDDEELFAYLGDELGGGEEERLRAHLAGCRACTARLLDLEPLATPDEPQAAAADFELAAAWRDFETRRSEASRPAAGRGRFYPLAAAALLVLAVGLSFWALDLRQINVHLRSEIASAQPNLPVVYLDAVRAEAPRSELPDSGLVLLMLSSLESEPSGDYAVEVFDAEGREVWAVEGLELSDHGSVRLGLPAESLSPGEYRVLLYGAGAAGRELAGEYRLRFEPQH